MARNAKSPLSFFSRCQSIACLVLLTLNQPAFALDELFEIYNAAQALAMGNAFTAEASGYSALFYNPAGLAKNEARKWEINPIALDGIFNGSFAGTAISNRALGMQGLLAKTQLRPGAYNYMKGSLVPSIARKGFALALIGNQDFVAKSDGTQVTARAGNDLGIVFGGASNFASNLLKIGVSGKILVRNQLSGDFLHSALGTDAAISALMKEGIGFGADLGVLLTLPQTWLPTLGFTWKDIGCTRFIPFHLLNASSSGAPQSIAQSFNLGFSARPAIGKGQRITLSAEFRHIELHTLSYFKRLHFGFQYMAHKSLYLWLGMNQLFPTGGAGLRLNGGDFEIGTYAQDIGQGTAVQADRRFFFRYTVNF